MATEFVAGSCEPSKRMETRRRLRPCNDSRKERNEERREAESKANDERPTTNDGESQPGFSTRAIHDGQEPDPLTGAVNVPIYASSTYVQEELGQEHPDMNTPRAANPTRDRPGNKSRFA